jgi:hypothetical protein
MYSLQQKTGRSVNAGWYESLQRLMTVTAYWPLASFFTPSIYIDELPSELFRSISEANRWLIVALINCLLGITSVDLALATATRKCSTELQFNT